MERSPEPDGIPDAPDRGADGGEFKRWLKELTLVRLLSALRGLALLALFIALFMFREVLSNGLVGIPEPNGFKGSALPAGGGGTPDETPTPEDPPSPASGSGDPAERAERTSLRVELSVDGVEDKLFACNLVQMGKET